MYKLIKMLVFIFCFLSSCDFYDENIVGSYRYVDSTHFSRYIEKDGKRLISDVVIQHSHDAKYIYALRQAVNHFICTSTENGKEYGASLVKNIFEYWIIEIDSANVIGPLSEADFIHFVKVNSKTKTLPLATINQATQKNFWLKETENFECQNAVQVDK